MDCSDRQRTKPSATAEKRKKANAKWNPIHNRVNDPIKSNHLKQRKQEASFLATKRTIPEQNALINQFIAEGTSKLKSVAADLDPELVLICAFVTWLNGEWMEEGTEFLGKRGGGNPVILNEDGSNIDPKTFTVHPEALATTDSHLITD
jgi:hypothetical protein